MKEAQVNEFSAISHLGVDTSVPQDGTITVPHEKVSLTLALKHNKP